VKTCLIGKGRKVFVQGKGLRLGSLKKTKKPMKILKDIIEVEEEKITPHRYLF